MFAENLEETCVLVLLKQFYCLTDVAGLAAEVEMSSHFLVGANVQLGDMDVLHYCRVFRQGGIYIFHTWAVDVVMPLHTDTVDGYTFFFHGLHHVVDAVALLGIGAL